MPELSYHAVSSRLKQTFAISRGSKTSAETIRVTLSENGVTGRGECVPYGRYGETVASVSNQIERARPMLESGIDRQALQTIMPPGAARCAIDCAFWDLEAKRSNLPVWQLAGLPAPKTLPCTMSLSLDTPEKMAVAATQTPAIWLKLKLGDKGQDIDRIIAVHEARPDARLIVDGNEGIARSDYGMLIDTAARNGVAFIEQPFGSDQDAPLLERRSSVPICADESVHTSADIADLSQKYQAVNIKLDKAGGLTEAINMLRQAQQYNLGVMIGCMVAGSLSMAPALLLGAAADVIDLDGPLWLADDIEHGLTYRDGQVRPATAQLWG